MIVPQDILINFFRFRERASLLAQHAQEHQSRRSFGIRFHQGLEFRLRTRKDFGIVKRLDQTEQLFSRLRGRIAFLV